MKRHPVRKLVFPIGDVDYEVRLPGPDVGMKLADLLVQPPEKLAKVKTTYTELFSMVLGVDLWNRLRDEVDVADAFRVGLATLAAFQVTLEDLSPTAWTRAEKAAETIWDSGINPEALAAYMAATRKVGTGGTKRSTRPGAATTTRTSASGTTTTNPKTRPARKAAKTSRGPRSTPAGR